MTIYFGTNREPDVHSKPTRFGSRINSRLPGELRFGTARIVGDSVQIDVARETARGGVLKLMPKDNVFEQLRQTMVANPGSDILVFVHGYNVSFDEAIRDAAAICQAYGGASASPAKTYIPFVFSWPSDGSLLPLRAYYSDRDDAASSALALRRGFEKLASFLGDIAEKAKAITKAGGDGRGYLCNGQIHVLAHSMGNFALSHAVDGISRNNARARRLWGEVILAAADEDETVFEPGSRFHRLGEFCNRVSIYINRNDRALIISDVTKPNPDRLGALGPRNPRALSTQVEIVDCQRVAGGSLTQHSYYRTSPAVVADIAAVLGGKAGSDIDPRSYDPQKNHYRLGQA